jgi:hypothetical protein
MNTTISVKEKSVWGNVLVYPNNETAVKFTQLLNKKTFAPIDLEIIKSLGYNIEYIAL